MTSPNAIEASMRYGRAVLGCLLESPESWPQTAHLSAEDFHGDDRKIFAAIKHLHEHNCEADIVAVTTQLGDSVPAEYVGRLVDGNVHANMASYVRHLRDATKERKLNGLIEQLRAAKSTDQRFEVVIQMQAVLATAEDAGDWRGLFHTRAEIENAPPLRFAIDGFLQEEGITLIGGLAGHGKTLCMLAMVRALLEEGKLFTKFQATRAADRVLYLIPEAGLGPFSARLKTFRLTDYVGERLFVRTLSAKEPLSLTDVRLLKAAEGADVFLDTAVRFMQGDENDASEQRAFAESLFRLQAAGARTITGAHHSPKSFSKDNVMTLENVLRGSGDIGAMLVTAWGLKQIDATTNQIYIANVKPRDFQPCEPFIIQGRPSLDQTGYFEMTAPPGFAGHLSDHAANVGRPAIASDKREEAERLYAQNKSYRQISQALGISVGTISKWLGNSKKPHKESSLQDGTP
jgi:DNA-binding CsgD family transcriptional regulator